MRPKTVLSSGCGFDDAWTTNVIDTEGVIFKKNLGVAVRLAVAFAKPQRRRFQAGPTRRGAVAAVRGVRQHADRDDFGLAGEELKRPLLHVDKQILGRIRDMKLGIGSLVLIFLDELG